MPIQEILRIKNSATIQDYMNKKATKIQRWWRNRLLDKKRGFAPMGIWEIKKMFDKVIKIQQWYRGLILMRE